MIVLDTHVLLWLVAGDSKIGVAAKKLIRSNSNHQTVSVSAMSFWEIAMLYKKGRISLDRSPSALRLDLLERGLVEVPLSGDIGIRAGEIDYEFGDPVDRILLATSEMIGPLVTADTHILKWKNPLQRIDARK